jgi:hypothetical protein
MLEKICCWTQMRFRVLWFRFLKSIVTGKSLDGALLDCCSSNRDLLEPASISRGVDASTIVEEAAESMFSLGVVVDTAASSSCLIFLLGCSSSSETATSTVAGIPVDGGGVVMSTGRGRSKASAMRFLMFVSNSASLAKKTLLRGTMRQRWREQGSLVVFTFSKMDRISCTGQTFA